MSTIATVLFAATLAAQPGNTPPQPAKTTASAAAKARDTSVNKNAAPDADLIGFLGDYEDAADGLDPIGLSEQIADDRATAAANKKKDGHGP